MASFQAKTCWERPRQSENENYCFDHFQPDPQQRIPKKIAKKFKKLQNTIIAYFPANAGQEKPRKSENKNYHSIISYPTPDRELKKKSSKKYFEN